MEVVLGSVGRRIGRLGKVMQSSVNRVGRIHVVRMVSGRVRYIWQCVYHT